MESLSGSGQAGIGIRDCTLQVRVLRLVSALASASLAGLAGVGTTGDLIGITTVSFSIITATSPTAVSSSIVTTSIARVRAAEPAFAAGALAGDGGFGVPPTPRLRLGPRAANPVPILVPLAAFILVEAADPF